jgi:RNA-directed DNA polymerase
LLTKSGGLIEKQGKGTPQGGVISPLLANLFLHCTFDQWPSKNHPTVKFVRYADDAIIRCVSQAHAEFILQQVNKRMQECVLELHKVKKKIVYFKDAKRRGKHPIVKFDF